jgi:hypothetical protein
VQIRQVPTVFRMRRTPKVTPPIRDFLKSGYCRKPHPLRGKMIRRRKISVSAALIHGIKRALIFSWQPTQYVQQLNELQIAERIALCRKLIGMPQSLAPVCFSDASRVVLFLASTRRLWPRCVYQNAEIGTIIRDLRGDQSWVQKWPPFC